jgi:hypothetical protein
MSSGWGLFQPGPKSAAREDKKKAKEMGIARVSQVPDGGLDPSLRGIAIPDGMGR